MNVREVSQAERLTYENDGAAHLPNMFSADWIEFLCEAFKTALAEPGPHAEEYTPEGKSGRFFADLNMWQRLEPFRKFVFDSPASIVAAQIMGATRINFLYDQMFVKEPSTEEETPWHQDQPYWAVKGRQVCSIWIPLDPVTKDSGLRFIKGSHFWEAYNPHHFADDTPYEGTGLPELPQIDISSEEHEILSWNVEPGDCLVFQGMIVHGAFGNPNPSQIRRALATRWCGDDVRYFRGKGESAIPTSDPGLNNGDLLDCALFPRVC